MNNLSLYYLNILSHLLCYPESSIIPIFTLLRHANWVTNNNNTHIPQYLKKYRQSIRNEIWLTNKIQIKRHFLQKSCRNWGMETSFRPHFVLKKFYMRKKKRATNLTSTYFDSRRLGHTLKTNYKTSDCWCWDLFSFLKKRSGTSFFTLFCIDFVLLLEVLGNIYIIINCFPVCDIWKLETNLSFLIMPFFYVTETIRTKI